MRKAPGSNDSNTAEDDTMNLSLTNSLSNSALNEGEDDEKDV